MGFWNIFEISFDHYFYLRFTLPHSFAYKLPLLKAKICKPKRASSLAEPNVVCFLKLLFVRALSYFFQKRFRPAHQILLRSFISYHIFCKTVKVIVEIDREDSGVYRNLFFIDKTLHIKNELSFTHLDYTETFPFLYGLIVPHTD